MILTTHILAGAALTSQMPHPVLGLSIAYFSHYVLDSLPHAEYNIKGIKSLPTKDFKMALSPMLKVALDLSVAFSILIFIGLQFDQALLLILLGGFIGALPDGLNFIRIMTKERIPLLNKERRIHKWIHFDKEKKYNPSWGYITQFIVISFALYALTL